MQNTTHVDECMHSFNVNMHDAIVKNLNINSKRLQETHSQNITYDLDI